MPLINYSCSCGHKEGRLLSGEQLKAAPSSLECPQCKQNTLKRKFGAAAAKSIVTVDNGNAQAVELNLDVIYDNLTYEHLPDRGE